MGIMAVFLPAGCSCRKLSQVVTGGQVVQSLLPQRLEGIRTPRDADVETLRMCTTEQDAVVAAIVLSRLTMAEIGARIGVSKQAVAKWQRRGVPQNRIRAFCNATGTRLVEQYLQLERSLRKATGKELARDRIAAIVAPTERAWRVA